MIKSKQEPTHIEIDLTGPRGNAFYLMGKAEDLAKQLGKDSAVIINEMKSGNYDHLLEVFEREFGAYVTLYRSDPPDNDDSDEWDDED